jgi:hypothetical protein
MTVDTPLPERGLLGAWFFDSRFYDGGRDRVDPSAPVGYPANLKNGVTVGVSGDPSREFGAAAFDADSNQYADVGETLQKTGSQAVAAVVKPTDDTDRMAVASNLDGEGFLFDYNRIADDTLSFGVREAESTNVIAAAGTAQTNEYVSCVGSVEPNDNISLYTDGSLAETKTFGTIKLKDETFTPLRIGSRGDAKLHWNGEIAAVGRYDLTVSDAPEPSEIAERWDRLTDIPGTR